MALVELVRYHVGAHNEKGMLDDTRIMVRDDDGDIHHLVIRGKGTTPTKAQVDAFKVAQEPILMAMKVKAKLAQEDVAEPKGVKVEP